MKNPFLIMTCAIFSASAAAQQACKAFEAEIDNSYRTIAMEQQAGLGDNSVPRESLRQAKIANELTSIEIHIRLMAENKCPPLKEPIAASAYFTSALKCGTARLKGQINNSFSTPEECRKESWVRDAPVK
jgi:hypothetical protein